MPSTVIRSFRYDPGHRELVVTFQTNRCYSYRDVPEDVFLAMKSSFSKGEFFNAHIRDKYGFVRKADARPEGRESR
jgi:lysyl-tRNA synthetase class 2